MTTFWAWCWKCQKAMKADRALPEVKCARCGGKCQRLTVEPKPKQHEYRLTFNDIRLLQQLRIDPEVQEAT